MSDEDLSPTPAADAEPSAAPKRRVRKPAVAKLPAEVLPAPEPEAVLAPEAPVAAEAPAPRKRTRKPVAVESVSAPSVEAAAAPAGPAAVLERERPVEAPKDEGDAAGDGPDRAPREPSLVVAAEEAAAAVGERLAGLLSEGDALEAPETVEEPTAAEAERRVLAPEFDTPKLQKVLAQSGIGSRRDIEAWIAEGKVEVNGEPAHIGQRVVHGDRIALNGKPVKVRIAPPLPRILAYHKPVGEIVTFNDPEGRPTVFRSLPRLGLGKWLSVGRLDINTEGLLLFTNSGDLANQLMHPRFGVEREYAVRTLGTLEEEQKAKLLGGVEVDGQTAAFRSIESAGGEGVNRWYRVVITEGRNREVRKLFDTVGLTVSRLIRVRYGNLVLPLGLKRGVWVELSGWDVKQIRRLAAPAQPQGQGAGSNAPREGREVREPREPREPRESREPRSEDPNNRRGKGKGPRPDASNRPERTEPRPELPRPERAPQPQRVSEDDDDFMPRDINPLEQTFDRRFANNKGRGFPQGFGHGNNSPQARREQQRDSSGQREPDPMQTSVGYIGADSFLRRGGGGGGGGGGGQRSGGGGGGGGGGQRGGGKRRR